MAWDDRAKKTMIKAYGTVEAGMQWDILGQADVPPRLAVGLAQWTDDRGAAILMRIAKAHNINLATRCPTLGPTIVAHPGTDGYWSGRAVYNGRAELKPVLREGKAEQQKQMIEDYQSQYIPWLTARGYDNNTNTQACIFLGACVHHGGAAGYATAVARNAGRNASLEAVYRAALNNGIGGRYRTRQDTLYRIIKAWDTSGVNYSSGSDSEDNTTTEARPSVGSEVTVPLRRIKYGEVHGSQMLMRMSDQTVVTLVKNPQGLWTVLNDPGKDAVVHVADGEIVNQSRSNASGSTGSAKSLADAERKLENWFKQREHRFSYRQARPSGLDPDHSGHTDCSGCVAAAYRDAVGIPVSRVGTWTGEQANRGNVVYDGPKSGVPWDKCKYGDLFIYGYNRGNTHHVAMFAPLSSGQRDRFWDAGSAPCPRITNTHSWDRGPNVMIRRHLS